MRNRRSGIEDRWTKADGTPSAVHGKGKQWRARYVDDTGTEHAQGFRLKREAQKWLDGQTAALVAGTHVAPRDARVTVSEWCMTWLDLYQVHRDSTVAQARVHIRQIEAEFGDMALSAGGLVARQSVDGETQGRRARAQLPIRAAPQVVPDFGDAVYHGMLGRNPCSRKTSPDSGTQKPYVATTEQIWQLCDLMPDHLRVAVLLGAFAGLRISEASGLRIADVDFTRGAVHPVQQWGGKPLKTDGSDARCPSPGS